jgi:hypothetical protein
LGLPACGQILIIVEKELRMKVVVLALALMLSMFAAGCGAKPEGAKPPAPNASEAPKLSEEKTLAKSDCKDLPESKLPQDIDIKIPSVPEGIQGASGGEKP